MTRFNSPSEITEDEFYKRGYREGYIEGLLASKHHINSIREFLRGTTYSTDPLVNMIKCSIDETIEDMQNSKRVLSKKGMENE